MKVSICGDSGEWERFAGTFAGRTNSGDADLFAGGRLGRTGVPGTGTGPEGFEVPRRIIRHIRTMRENTKVIPKETIPITTARVFQDSFKGSAESEESEAKVE